MGPSRGDPPVGWRWWAKLGVVLATATAAVLLILVGAARFLDQAQREHDRVACLQAQVREQAQGTAAMASAVLDLSLSADQRRRAVATWSRAQAGIAQRIGAC